MKHIVSCSFGKDSLATVILAAAYGLPLDAAVYVRVMFDETRSAEPPEHEAFIHNVAIPKLQSWGIPVIVLQSKKTFKDVFYHERRKGGHVGQIIGFPMQGKCEVNSACKRPCFKQAGQLFPGEEVIQYVGIAVDEPKRLERLKENHVSLLAKYGYTEAMATYLCKHYGLLSPMYEYSTRGGCFFCPNARDSALLHLKQHHPDLWRELLDMSAAPNKIKNTFSRTETLEEIDARLGG